MQNQNASYERILHIEPNDTDVMCLWRPSSAFVAMQNMADEHALKLGCARSDFVDKLGMIWMLARVHLEMQIYPRANENVLVRTWPGLPSRVTCPRYFTIMRENGEILGGGSTSWVLVGLEKRRILPMTKLPIAMPDTSHIPVTIPEPQRFRLSEEGYVREIIRAPLYSEIDLNGHMNNACYMAWVSDMFPLERHKTSRIRSVTMNYASEAVPGEDVCVRLYEQGDNFEVRGTHAIDGHTIFEAKGFFSPLNAFEV